MSYKGESFYKIKQPGRQSIYIVFKHSFIQ